MRDPHALGMDVGRASRQYARREVLMLRRPLQLTFGIVLVLIPIAVGCGGGGGSGRASTIDDICSTSCACLGGCDDAAVESCKQNGEEQSRSASAQGCEAALDGYLTCVVDRDRCVNGSWHDACDSEERALERCREGSGSTGGSGGSRPGSGSGAGGSAGGAGNGGPSGGRGGGGDDPYPWCDQSSMTSKCHQYFLCCMSVEHTSACCITAEDESSKSNGDHVCSQAISDLGC